MFTASFDASGCKWYAERPLCPVQGPVFLGDGSVRVYWECGKRAFQEQLAHRTASLAGLITKGFFGYVRAAILLPSIPAGAAIAGYGAHDAVTYAWVTQSLAMALSLFSWWPVAQTIRTGNIVFDLCRPFSFLGYWQARDAGRASYFLLFRTAPILLLGQVVYGLRWPEAPGTWLALVVSVTLALTVSFSWRMMLNLAAFWTTDARGLGGIAGALMLFLSGFIVPLRFFPDWLRPAIAALPFAGMVQIPCDVFLEVLSGRDLALALAQQAIWAVVMLAAAQLVLSRATRRLVTQGG